MISLLWAVCHSAELQAEEIEEDQEHLREVYDGVYSAIDKSEQRRQSSRHLTVSGVPEALRKESACLRCTARPSACCQRAQTSHLVRYCCTVGSLRGPESLHAIQGGPNGGSMRWGWCQRRLLCGSWGRITT